MKLTQEALGTINTLVAQRDQYQKMVESAKIGHKLFIKRELQKGEQGQSTFAYIDLVEPEAKAFEEMFQARIDSINACLAGLGVEISE